MIVLLVAWAITTILAATVITARIDHWYTPGHRPSQSLCAALVLASVVLFVLVIGGIVAMLIEQRDKR